MAADPNEKSSDFLLGAGFICMAIGWMTLGYWYLDWSGWTLVAAGFGACVVTAIVGALVEHFCGVKTAMLFLALLGGGSLAATLSLRVLEYQAELRTCEPLSVSGMGFEWSATKVVTGVEFRNPELGDAELAALTPLKHVSRMDLRHSRVGAKGLGAWADRRNLRELALDYTSISDTELSNLAGMTGLESLSLEGLDVTDKGIRHLEGLVNLRKLNLSRTLVGTEIAKVLVKLPSLRRLTVKHCGWNREAAAQLEQKMSNLLVEY